MQFKVGVSTGRLIEYPNVREHDIHSLDIAHALSNTCRWGGHTSEFYSVAQHSILCSYNCGSDPHVQLAALLHDAAEAYPPGDVIRPVKLASAEVGATTLADVEKTFDEIIRRKYLPWEKNESAEAVRTVDRRMLATEWVFLMGGSVKDCSKLFHAEPFDWEVFPACLPPKLACRDFLTRWAELSGMLGGLFWKEFSRDLVENPRSVTLPVRPLEPLVGVETNTDVNKAMDELLRGLHAAFSHLGIHPSDPEFASKLAAFLDRARSLAVAQDLAARDGLPS